MKSTKILSVILLFAGLASGTLHAKGGHAGMGAVWEWAIPACPHLIRRNARKRAPESAMKSASRRATRSAPKPASRFSAVERQPRGSKDDAISRCVFRRARNRGHAAASLVALTMP